MAAKEEPRFTGNFLDATDVMSKGKITVTISDFVPENVEKDAAGKTINKPIIAFQGAKKRLILNKTNEKAIVMAYGAKASDWIGKPITLTVRYLKEAFGQKNLPVVRVMPPEGAELTFGMRKHYGSDKSLAAPARQPCEEQN